MFNIMHFKASLETNLEKLATHHPKVEWQTTSIKYKSCRKFIYV